MLPLLRIAAILPIVVIALIGFAAALALETARDAGVLGVRKQRITQPDRAPEWSPRPR